MTDAPERTLWLKFDAQGQIESISSEPLPDHDAYSSYAALTAATARADAAEAALANAEADALRRAAALAHTSINQGGLAKSFAHFLRVKDHDAYHQAVREYEAAILALIPKDGA